MGFLGSSVSYAVKTNQVQPQLPNIPGRLSRALPLYLAERIELASSARAQTLMPWLVAPDFLVTSHITQHPTEWIVELRVIGMSDARCLGELSHSFALVAPGEAFNALAERLLSLLPDVTGITPEPAPRTYALPDANSLPQYLLRLEQLLALRCSAIEGVPAGFLHGEREILQGNLELCLIFPRCVNIRLLFAQTLLAMNRIRPDILPEFAERAARLQKEHPLVGPAQQRLQTLFDEAFAV